MNKIKKCRYLFLLITILIPLLFLNSNLFYHSIKKNTSDLIGNNNESVNHNVKISQGVSTLFEGTEQNLNITDTGNLYEYNQYVSVSNQEEVNLSYYLDEVHNWKVSKINTNIKNIQDTREWVNNSDFFSLDNPYNNYSTFDNYDPPGGPSHNYSADLLNDPSTPANIDNIIYSNGASAIRLHFSRIEIETDWDLLCIYDKNNNLQFSFTGMATNFYTPWIKSDTLKITFNTDGSVEWYGYSIDYFDPHNESRNYFDYNSSWGYSSNIANNNFGPVQNDTAMYVALVGEPSRGTDMDVIYYEDDYVEIYQNITIPRGSIFDGYFSFDYYAEYAMDSNENYIYCEINNERIYSKGLGDIVDIGRKTWHTTGKINIDLWSNSSKLFNDIKSNNIINISVGIMSGASISYSGFDERFQQIFLFDNISLVLTTLANATQSDINLTFNSNSLIDGVNWGNSYQNFTGTWSLNPIILTVQTSSPALDFELDTILFGYHNTTSKVEQTSESGVSFKILENGSVYWEFFHNFFMPSQYEDFEFIIKKPVNWQLLDCLDPTLQPKEFEGGNIGDDFIKINVTNAIFPGWWSFKAESPNYLNLSNTKILKESQWITNALFNTGESTQIKTQLNFSDEIPTDAGVINLTIYHPNGTIFYKESIAPVGGNVSFSEIFFGAYNTSGGLYEYTLFWSNGTALGGLKSSFVVIHQSSITILKPDDAISDLITDAFFGDILPLRIQLQDLENNASISNALVTYNWSSGLKNFTESALGIYETILDTSELNSNGFYEIFINSSKLGFTNYNITLKINLLEETNLLRLESSYYIELHDNSTVRYSYTNSSGGGISNAIVDINLNNSYHNITDYLDGNYTIEFDTSYITNLGVYQIELNFSKAAFETQNAILQFEIIEQSINLSVYINSQEIQKNSLTGAMFKGNLTISIRAFATIDEVYLPGGNVTWNSDGYNKEIIEGSNSWFNYTIALSPDNFSIGLNYVYLRFQKEDYSTTLFSFQLLIDQIDLQVDSIDFEDTINAEIGETLNIQLRLLDPNNNETIESAMISFTWDYGFGSFNATSNGIYQYILKLPENLKGNYQFDLFINPNNNIYKATQYSFVVVISEAIIEDNSPGLLLWSIILILIGIVSALGILSLRSYVLLPRKRKRESELLSKTQRFKDLNNIQAVVVVHTLSGIPIYTKSYSILEKRKKELFAGFIQAITMVGEEFSDESIQKSEEQDDTKSFGGEKMIELDFKQFHCLIADREEVRVIFILKEKASERLKSQVSHLMLALNLKLSKELEDWDGSLDMFEETIPSILLEYFELYYKESFKLAENINFLKLRKEQSLSKMEMRVINVILSMSKDKIIADLNHIIELVSEENKDLIIEAIELLIRRKLILPTSL